MAFISVSSFSVFSEELRSTFVNPPLSTCWIFHRGHLIITLNLFGDIGYWLNFSTNFRHVCVCMCIYVCLCLCLSLSWQVSIYGNFYFLLGDSMYLSINNHSDWLVLILFALFILSALIMFLYHCWLLSCESSVFLIIYLRIDQLFWYY